MTKMPRLISTNVKIIVDFIMKTRRKRWIYLIELLLIGIKQKII
jgi:hypothetical protein